MGKNIETPFSRTCGKKHGMKISGIVENRNIKVLWVCIVSRVWGLKGRIRDNQT